MAAAFKRRSVLLMGGAALLLLLLSFTVPPAAAQAAEKTLEECEAVAADLRIDAAFAEFKQCAAAQQPDISEACCANLKQFQEYAACLAYDPFIAEAQAFLEPEVKLTTAIAACGKYV